MDLKSELKYKMIHAFCFLLGIVVKPRKQILFESFYGRSYADNPRAISEKMHELFPDFQIVWALNNPHDIPSYVKTVSRGSLRFYCELIRSFCYVLNEAVKIDTPKRFKQVFIQTWHGDRGVKRIAYDAWENGKRPFPIMDEKLTDLFVIGSLYAEKRIKTAFRYNGNVLMKGCPRNDCLVIPRNGDEIRQKIGVPDGKKIILYAPTLRANHKVLKENVDIAEVLNHFNMRGGDWVCLVRAHPRSLGIEMNSNENVIDVSRYGDMADLLMIADALITDYSSCAGDFLLRKKPVILAHFDVEQYMEEERTFHVDINKTGYLIAKNQDELNKLIDSMTDEQFEDNCEQVLDFFGTNETGRASEEVCHWIEKQYSKSNT